MKIFTKQWARKMRTEGVELVNAKTVRKLAGIHWTINRRARIKAAILANAVNGKVDVVRKGRDCDCYDYTYRFLIDVPTSIVAFMKAEHDHEQSLDGTEIRWFEEPMAN